MLCRKAALQRTLLQGIESGGCIADVFYYMRSSGHLKGLGRPNFTFFLLLSLKLVSLRTFPFFGACICSSHILGSIWLNRTVLQQRRSLTQTLFVVPSPPCRYIYVRRVWAKADDGGCYFLSRSFPHPAPPAPGCRVNRVTDFVAGTVLRCGDREWERGIALLTQW